MIKTSGKIWSAYVYFFFQLSCHLITSIGAFGADATNQIELFVDGLRSGEEFLKAIPEKGTDSDETYSQKILQILSKTQLYQDETIYLLSLPNQEKTFKVVASKIRRIAAVKFNGITAGEEAQLKRLLRTQIGLVFSEQSLTIDNEKIAKRLQDRGYPQALTFEPAYEYNSEGDVVVTFNVQKGTPCLVAEVRTTPNETLLDLLNSPIELGTLCDRIEIESNLEKSRANLRAQGYLESDIRINSFRLSPDREKASISLQVSKGDRTRVEVINQQTGAVVDDFVQSKSGISAPELAYFSQEDLRQEIENSYKSKGYANATVSGPTQLKNQNSDTLLRFFVKTGSQVFVGRVQFLGSNLPLSKKEVLEKLELEPSFFTRKIVYNEKNLEKYRQILAGIFLDYGYLDVQVAPVQTYQNNSDSRIINLNFRLNSGPQYLVKDFTILGAPKSDEFNSEFFKGVLAPGKPVNRSRLKDLENETLLKLFNTGYPYAKVEAFPETEVGTGDLRPVNIFVKIVPGVETRIGRVFVEGETYDKSERIISLSGLKTGEIYSPETLESSRLRILKHDLFGSVSIEPLSSASIERQSAVIDLVIRTQARLGYTLGLVPGYGSRNGYKFSVDFSKNNITKHGLRFHSSASISQEKQQGYFNTSKQVLGRKISAGFIEPLFKFANYTSPFDLSFVSGLEVAPSTLSNRFFETIETGILYRPYFFDLNWTFQSKFVHEWSRVINTENAPLAAIDRLALRTHELVFSASLDTRNNVEWPTKGFVYDASTSHARFGLYSEVQYDRYSLDFTHFFPIAGRFSAAFSAGGMQVSNVINEKRETVTAPGSRRAGLTGRAMIRGFPDGSANLGPLLWLQYENPTGNSELNCGPKFSPLAATNLLYTKAELRYRSPILSNLLGFAWFIDAGNAYFTNLEEDKIKSKLAQDFNLNALQRQSNQEKNQCFLKQATLVGNEDIELKNKSVFRNFIQRSYVSTGLGTRLIIPNLASINLDWGFPVRDPADNDSRCISLSEVGETTNPPVCVNRRQPDKLFGLIEFPGAFFLGIGANF